MKKIRLLTLFVLSLLVGGTAFAQNRVSGVVTSEDGPIAGVVVQLKGTTVGVLTGADGSYTINNPQVANGTLVFSYAGMRKQEIAVGGNSTVNVVMQPDAIQASKVTVTALGGKKQDRKLGYATSTVQGDDLARTNAISPVNALQGKVAGLSIGTVGSSGLTGSPVVTMRGAKSLRKNNSPIFVVDGIIMENQEANMNSAADWNDGGNMRTMYGNQLKNLNANDYESITVLKGAAATSLYGSRGANGAIVITTKSGQARKGIGVEVNYSHEFTQLYAPALKLQNSYGMGSPISEYEGEYVPAWESSMGDNYYMSHSYGPSLNAGLSMRQHYKFGYDGTRTGNPIEPFTAHKNNWKQFYDNGRQDNVSIALTGGSEKANFRISYGYSDMKGIVPENLFKRHSVNVRATGQINDLFSTDFTLQYSHSKTKNAHSVASSGGAGLGLASTRYINRNTDVKWYKNNYIGENWQRMDVPAKHDTWGDSPLGGIQGALNDFYDKNETHREQTIIASVGLTAQFNEWLDANAKMTYNYLSVDEEKKNYGNGYLRGRATTPNVYTPGGGEYAISGYHEGSYNFLGQIHGNQRFLDDDLELDVRLFYEMYGNGAGGKYSKKTNDGLAVPGVWNFANSNKNVTQDQMSVEKKYRNNMTFGVGGAVNLSWKDQINLEVTARNDWLSTLRYPDYLPQGSNNYAIFYPSVNLAWVFSDTFEIDPNIISYGKLRASWGQVGSGTDPYQTTAGTGGYKRETYYTPEGDTPDYTVNIATANIGTLPNYDLKPEKQQSLEVGADVRFLNGRIGVDVAYYKINTKNQILELKAVQESGVGKRLINAGNIQNQGWEFQFDFRPIQSRIVRWDIGLNFTRNRSKIKKFHPEVKEYALSSIETGGVPYIYAFEKGQFGVITTGGGYGWAGNWAGAFARFRAQDAQGNLIDDPRNGKVLLAHSTDRTMSTGVKIPVYRIMGGGHADLTNYYHGADAEGYNTPKGMDYRYDTYGRVEPDFLAGMTTNLNFQIPNGGSIDLFAQIDGRKGGHVVSANLRETMQRGTAQITMYGRDKENGGLERTNYKGETVYNGMPIDGVFAYGVYDHATASLKTGGSIEGMTYMDAVAEGHILPTTATLFNYYNTGWATNNLSVFPATYFALREVTVGYNFPEKWIKHVGLQSARISFSGRNLCYIYNGLRGKINPESLSSNNPLTPIDFGAVPFTRNFSINLNLRF